MYVNHAYMSPYFLGVPYDIKTICTKVLSNFASVVRSTSLNHACEIMHQQK